MPDKKVTTVKGLIEESLPGLLFRVKATLPDGSEKEVLAHLGGKMKLYHIKVVPGDEVLIEMPDLNDRRGRIVRRL